jgi:uncharacterized protein (DUF885 family)
MTPVYELANTYVERWAALDPIQATRQGISGHDTELTDYSPVGAEARAALDRDTLAALAATPVQSDRDRIAQTVMSERLQGRLDEFDAREYLRALRNFASPVSLIRDCFDGMPKQTAADWETIAARMEQIPRALAGYEQSLTAGQQQGVVAAQRQALVCALQAETYSGQRGSRSFFHMLCDAYAGTGVRDTALTTRLERAADGAIAAFAATAQYLRSVYAPRASARDSFGAERYAVQSRLLNGIALDLQETYTWGWEELARLQRELERTAERIAPGAGIAGAIARLESDPSRVAEGAPALQHWLQQLEDRTIAALHGQHFDIPEPLKRLEVMIAPPGGALAMYYTPPTEDFSRPGRTWYPTGDRTRFPLWREASVAYHEGVPGHHLQVGQLKYLAGELSRFQRTAANISGYVEGWALYAERLMGELGYLEDAGEYLGMLQGQAWRTVRVIIDIGMHLELPIPAGQPFHAGERWNYALGLAFMQQLSGLPPDLAASEVDRYLGWGGQAISYKVGERIWLAVRAAAKQRKGAAFDLKAFHSHVLNLGPMGLAQLQQEVAAW